ncbi:hypothetical protein ACFYU9_04500 [Streptomyces sp. NPDC004327]|uniref:Rv1733c family protein n=1 Tax=unclassified Streptomyces TaxID=2593676 RepID=UPI0036ADE69C
MNSHEPSSHEAWDREPDRPRTGTVRRTAVLLILTVALICGAVAAGALWQAGSEADRALAAHRHRVTATTTARSVDPAVGTRFGAQPSSFAKAVWSYPKGVARSGTVDVPPRTPAGHPVTIWVNDAGAPSQPPGDATDRTVTALGGGAATTGLVAATAFGAVLLGRRSRARRFGDLEREWARVEPVWSGRLRRGGTGSGEG